jgi:uncharacterized lipoprotein
VHNVRRLTATTTLLAVTVMGLAGCSSDRWCEEDATDRRVSDSYCEQGTAGYEWEPDSDDSKVKIRKPVKKKRKR